MHCATPFPAVDSAQRLNSKVLLSGILGAVLAVVPSLHAEWAWATNEVTTAPAGEKVLATFTFQNTSDKAVTVTELRFACACAEFSFNATPAVPHGIGTLSVYLNRGVEAETWEFVAFGSEGTTPTPLTIRIPKPSSGSATNKAAASLVSGCFLPIKMVKPFLCSTSPLCQR